MQKIKFLLFLVISIFIMDANCAEIKKFSFMKCFDNNLCIKIDSNAAYAYGENPLEFALEDVSVSFSKSRTSPTFKVIKSAAGTFSFTTMDFIAKNTKAKQSQTLYIDLNVGKTEQL